jgi:hypothetical protein
LPCSKPADFGIGDIPQILPNPKTTVIQSDPVAKDSSANKAGHTSVRVEKEIVEEKISFADVGKNSYLVFYSSPFILDSIDLADV